MKIGAARVEITPPLGCPMDGYEARVGGATAVHDPLCVRVLAAEGRDGRRAVLVVADLLQVDPGLQAVVADRVRRATGIERDQLQLIGTHTHSGPLVRPGSEVEGTIGRHIAEAVGHAWSQRREAIAAVGVGVVDGIGANRRPHGGPVDDRVTVARFDDSNGRPIATFVNYGCHPTTLGPDNTQYSADYPGVLCRELEATIGGLALFTTGPQGDVNPGGYSPEESMVGIVAPWRTYESAERYGRRLADVAAAVHATLKPEASDRVWSRAEVVGLTRKQLPDAAVARDVAATARAASEQVRAADLSTDATYHAAVAAAYAKLIALQAADPARDGPVQLRISALALGPLIHLGVQGELFVALGQRVRAELGDGTTAIAALCDGTVGYIPTTAAFEEGGYEPNASVLRPGEGERLTDALVSLVRTAEPATDRPKA